MNRWAKIGSGPSDASRVVRAADDRQLASQFGLARKTAQRDVAASARIRGNAGYPGR
jgi:hypothetical protein